MNSGLLILLMLVMPLPVQTMESDGSFSASLQDAERALQEVKQQLGNPIKQTEGLSIAGQSFEWILNWCNYPERVYYVYGTFIMISAGLYWLCGPLEYQVEL